MSNKIKDTKKIDITEEPQEVAKSTIAPFGNIEDMELGFTQLSELYNSTDNEPLKRLINLASISLNKNNPNNFSIGNDWNDFTAEDEGGKHGLRRVPMRAKGGKNSGKVAVLAAKALLGVGSPIDIPLVHSGFTIRIESQDPYAKTVLYAKLAKLANDAGMSTASLVFSSDHSLFSRVIMDYVVENLISSTLKIPAGKNIVDYILLADDYAIMLGVMSSLFENGFDVVLGCKNTLIVKETTVACDAVIKGKMDPIEALYTDTAQLTEYQNKQMSITEANTIYIEAAMAPKPKSGAEEKTIYALDTYHGTESRMTMDKEIVIENVVNDKNIPVTVELAIPSYTTYFDYSSRYLSELEELIQSVITSDVTNEEQQEMMRDGVKLMVINDSSHYIKTLKIGDAKYYDNNDIYDIIRSIVSNPLLTNSILNTLNDFKKETLISMAGTPIYECDKCKKEVGEATNPLTSSVSPINPYHFFSRLREASA